MRGVEKFWLMGAGSELIFFTPILKGGQLFGENFSLLVVTSALKSQRRVRCEFGVICFLEIDFLLPEIN